ncbi:MAG: helix-turn-helix domain-containing protein [Castellaniella sp.]
MDTTVALQQLGFTEYEARAYVALVQAGELNGYELAKKTGIPRANIYAVANKLLERGAVLRTEREGAQRYSAIPAQQLLDSLDARHQRSLQAAHAALERQQAAHSPAPVFDLRGKELLTRAQHLIDGCQHTLMVALQPAEAAALARPLASATQRGVQVTTLCLQACPQPCGGCQGDIHCLSLVPADATRWLLVVADHASALVGQTDAQAAQGLSTTQEVVVQLAEAFIRQYITLAALGQALEPQLNQLQSQPALRQLDSLFPDGGFPAFLKGLVATPL